MSTKTVPTSSTTFSGGLNMKLADGTYQQVIDGSMTTAASNVAVGRGSLGALISSTAITSLGTAQNSTPTAAQLLTGILTQTGATGAGTVTLPTGTLVSAAVPNVTVGDTFTVMFANLGGGQTLTITGATGTTVLGTATVATATNIVLTFVNTGTNTWNIYTNK
jgi:hypothetical protein